MAISFLPFKNINHSKKVKLRKIIQEAREQKINKILFTFKFVDISKVFADEKYIPMTEFTQHQNLSTSGIINNISRKEKEIEKPQTNRQQNSHFLYQGNTKSFLQALNKLTQQDMKQIMSCRICLIGEQIKPANPKCFFLTLIIGLCLLFPFFFFCCQWWKKAVSQIFELEEEAYKGISYFLKNKNLKSVQIIVYDNFLSKNKIKAIVKGVSKAHLRKFIFINQAGAFDMNNYQYTKFQENFQAFNKLQLQQWSLRWYRSKLEKQELIQ